jgi:hypothetical protein
LDFLLNFERCLPGDRNAAGKGNTNGTIGADDLFGDRGTSLVSAEPWSAKRETVNAYRGLPMMFGNPAAACVSLQWTTRRKIEDRLPVSGGTRRTGRAVVYHPP